MASPSTELHRVPTLAVAFEPRSVAVIGASPRRGSVGGAIVDNLLTAGSDRPVFPVNPALARVCGCRTYSCICDVPAPVDLAVICTPAPSVPDIIRQCGEAGVAAAVIISAGFRESGAKGADLERQLAEAIAGTDGLRVIGPNCLGLIVPGTRLNASFAKGMPLPGSVAVISQSGALCTALLDWALEERIGFSQFVSTGNMTDVDFADLIDHAAVDSRTESIVLYIESVRDGARLVDAARRCPKPIIAYKAGRHPQAAKAAATHTGAMAGDDAVFEAAFRQAGIERVKTLPEMLGAIRLLAAPRRAKGTRLAIVTNAGGPGVIAADALADHGGTLAVLSPAVSDALSTVLPPHWSHANPVDIIGDADAGRFGDALPLVLADPHVDAALVMLTPQAMIDPTDAARGVAHAASQSEKPVLTAWMGGQSVHEARRLLHDAHIPTYTMPEDAIEAFVHVTNARGAREVPYFPLTRPSMRVADPAPARRCKSRSFGRGGVLNEPESKGILAEYGIEVAPATLACTREEAVAAATHVDGPVVLKIVSPQATHKSEVAGVALNLNGAVEVGNAYDQLIEQIHARLPGAAVAGVCVQPMISDPDGVELIVGARRDPAFGVVVMVGAGGTRAELLADRVVLLPPVNHAEILAALGVLRVWPLLKGFRGRPEVDLEALTCVVQRLTLLMTDHPEVLEIEANPLLVRPRGAVALDARIVARPLASGDSASFTIAPESLTASAIGETSS